MIFEFVAIFNISKQGTIWSLFGASHSNLHYLVNSASQRTFLFKQWSSNNFASHVFTATETSKFSYHLVRNFPLFKVLVIWVQIHLVSLIKTLFFIFEMAISSKRANCQQKSMWAGAESKLSSRSKACDFAALPCHTSSLAYAEPMHAGACPIQASALSVSPSVTSWRIFLFKEMHWNFIQKWTNYIF